MHSIEVKLTEQQYWLLTAYAATQTLTLEQYINELVDDQCNNIVNENLYAEGPNTIQSLID